ncbi:MAG: arylsulfatase [Pirellulaceae bacterium]
MKSIVTTLIVCLALVVGQVSTAADRPNIVLIMSDDMGFSDIGCYGGEIPTPTLDSLASNGLRFTQFYNTGRCCPTRASLLTGLYPHQAGVGHMMSDDGLPGYQGDLNGQCRTIAEVLRPAGYGTYMAGKWHVTKHIAPAGDKHNWPLQRGFDRFYGTIHGAGSFYDPNTLTRDNTFISPYADSEYQPEQFYYTDAIADHAVRFIGEHKQQRPDDPFFVYVAFTAAHWPMHALESDIAKFKGKYDQGYVPIQQSRLKKLRELGLIDPNWVPAPLVGDWDNETDQAWQSRCMEVYAAMIHSMDRGIGRIVQQLEESGELENTLILFLQDNGGCAEGYGRKAVGDGPRASEPTLAPLAADYLQPDMRTKQTRDGYQVREGRGVMPGAADTDLGYGEEWANVSNTPFRLYKHYVHEGGISTPLIAHWPAGIPVARRSQLEPQPGHLIDIMATAVDLAAAQYPVAAGDEGIHALEGISLAPAFIGRELERPNPIYWEHEGNRAVRKGKWKLVARGATGPWELYDMSADRTEMQDLAGEHAELVRQLADEWEGWAKRALVKPWKWNQPAKEVGSARIAKQKRKFVVHQNDELLKGSPDIGGKTFTVSTTIQESGQGVVIAQGGVTHGWAVYFDKVTGAPAIALRRGGKLETFVSSHNELPTEPFELVVTLASDGALILKVGNEIAIEKMGILPLVQTPLDPLCAGFDSNDPVGNYSRGFRFSGKFGKLKLTLEP